MKTLATSHTTTLVGYREPKWKQDTRRTMRGWWGIAKRNDNNNVSCGTIIWSVSCETSVFWSWPALLLNYAAVAVLRCSCFHRFHASAVSHETNRETANLRGYAQQTNRATANLRGYAQETNRETANLRGNAQDTNRETANLRGHTQYSLHNMYYVTLNIYDLISND